MKICLILIMSLILSFSGSITVVPTVYNNAVEKVSETYFLVEQELYQTDSKGPVVLNAKYPKIEGITDGTTSDFVNNIMRERAVELFIHDWDVDSSTLIDYEVKYSDKKLISILFKGHRKLSGITTEYCYAINITTVNWNVAELSELVDLAKIEHSIKEGNYKLVTKGLEQSHIQSTQIIKDFNEQPIRREDNNHSYDFYVTDSIVGIIVSTPPYKGSYVILEFARDEVSIN